MNEKYTLYGVIITLSIAILAYIINQTIRNIFVSIFSATKIKLIFQKNPYVKITKKHHKEMCQAIRHIQHPATRAAVMCIAKNCAIHLLENEPVRLEEYLDILTTFIEGDYIQECHFFAKTRPSDWFTQEERIPNIKKYWDAQVRLKEHLDDKIKMSRYLILPQSVFDGDSQSGRLITAHRENRIMIHHSNCDAMPKNFLSETFDGAFYKDRRGGMWLIQTWGLDEDTVNQYLQDSSKVTIRIKLISDPFLLRNFFTAHLGKLQYYSKDLSAG